MENTKNMSFTESIIILACAVGCLIFGSLNGLSTAVALHLTAGILMIYAIIRFKMKFEDLQDACFSKIHSSMLCIYIVILAGFNAVTWIMAGTTPYLTQLGLKVLTPATCLIVAFVLNFLATMLTGQAWGIMPTIGLACFTIANALGINPALSAGVIISSTYLGDTLAPLSDGPNYMAAMTDLTCLDVVKSMIPISVGGALIGTIIAGILGMNSVSTTSSEEAEKIYTAISSTGSYSIICLLPIVVLLVLIFIKVPIIPSVLGSSFSALIIAVFKNGYSFLDAISNAWYGISSETGNPIIDAMFSASGASGTASTVFIIFGASWLACMIVTLHIPETILSKFERFCSTPRTLVCITLISNIFVLFATGSIYTTMTVMGNMFKEKYEQVGLGKSVLAMLVYPFQNMITVFLPWSVMCSATYPLIGYTGSPYAILPYITGTFGSIGLLIIFVILGKYNFSSKKIS